MPWMKLLATTSLAVLAGLGPAQISQATALPEGAAMDAFLRGEGAPLVTIFCSRTKLRTPVAAVTWAMPAALNDANLGEAMTSRRLEVTPFKDGFTRGLYGRVFPVRADQGFTTLAAETGAAVTAQSVPALQSLRVVTVTTLQQRTSPENRLYTPPNLYALDTSDNRNRIVVTEVEGLEPGVNYYWRTSATGTVAATHTPVCPGGDQ
jgi:hypothetical protein